MLRKLQTLDTFNFLLNVVEHTIDESIRYKGIVKRESIPVQFLKAVVERLSGEISLLIGESLSDESDVLLNVLCQPCPLLLVRAEVLHTSCKLQCSQCMNEQRTFTSLAICKAPPTALFSGGKTSVDIFKASSKRMATVPAFDSVSDAFIVTR